MSITVEPVPLLQGASPYQPPRPGAPIDLHLDANEGVTPPVELLTWLAQAAEPELLRGYPDASSLEALIAARHGLTADAVIVTAGADDAMERACRSVLAPGRQLVLPVPTFEMLDRFARGAGGEVVTVPWSGGNYPTQAVLEASTATTKAIAVVTPNNPTGAVASADDLRALAAGAPQALILVDLAYGEFADADLTEAALDLPNAIVFRTLSKAWGLAGLRVGYALGPPRVIRWLRTLGLPYAVSGVALALAERWLEQGDGTVRKFIATVRSERGALTALLGDLGADPFPSQANFVLARFAAADWVRDALAGLGIGVRSFPRPPELVDCLRITCPGDVAQFERLGRALQTARRPQAILFDMDGVLVDVSRSYRQAIVDTAACYGVTLTAADVATGKRAGEASNDWELTRRLLGERGVDAPLGEVTERFETRYQGTDAEPGLRRLESLIPARSLLEALAARLPLGIVTGRPRGDAERFLSEQGLGELFRSVVCMEDGPGKPDPAPVVRCLAQLGVTRAWMVGDTPDDMRSARRAGVVPIGIAAAGDERAAAESSLIAAGAGRNIGELSELLGLLEAK